MFFKTYELVNNDIIEIRLWSLKAISGDSYK